MNHGRYPARMYLLFCLVGCFLQCSGESARESLEAAARRQHEETQQPGEGIVLAELANGKKTFAGAGALKKGGASPDETTLFETGSATKVFTAILLAEAVREGRASLDDPVSRFLPPDWIPGDSPLREMSLESLATHTSGLPRLPENLDSGIDPANPYAHYDGDALRLALRRLDRDDLESPGEYAYSNLGFGLLGHLLERCFEQPYPELLRDRIFRPLGMDSSFVLNRVEDIPESLRGRLATPHRGGREVPHWEFDVLMGAGAVVSSAADLLRFAEAHWDSDTPEALRLSLAEASRPRHAHQALGWLVDGSRRSHQGGTGGFRSRLQIDPEKRTARVELANSSGESDRSESRGDFSRFAGLWEGVLRAGGRELPLLFHVRESGKVRFFSVDEGGFAVTASRTVVEEGRFRFSFPAIEGTYAGVAKPAGLRGTWSQSGGEFPLELSPTKDFPERLERIWGERISGDLADSEGFWSGFLGGKDGLFLYLEIDTAGNSWAVNLFSPDQTLRPIPVSAVVRDGSRWEFRFHSIGASYVARQEGRVLSGAWHQGPPQKLKLTWSGEKPSR